MAGLRKLDNDKRKAENCECAPPSSDQRRESTENHGKQASSAGVSRQIAELWSVSQQEGGEPACERDGRQKILQSRHSVYPAPPRPPVGYQCFDGYVVVPLRTKGPGQFWSFHEYF